MALKLFELRDALNAQIRPENGIIQLHCALWSDRLRIDAYMKELAIATALDDKLSPLAGLGLAVLLETAGMERP